MQALEERRAYFKSMRAQLLTDHAAAQPTCHWRNPTARKADAIFQRAPEGAADEEDR
ncbi:MAG: hypothetical protein U0Y68_22200 [Blastocatellia bacterium]